MSSRWPSSLLNATNQQLTERIEQVSFDLESKRNAVEESREVVELLKRNQKNIERQAKTAAEALASKRETLERDEGKLKQLCLEADAAGRQVRSLKEEEARLASAAAALEASMEHQRRRLEEGQKSAVALEAEAKEIILAHLARQRVGEELSAAQRELSSTVWAKLDRLNDKVRASAQQLESARVEHAQVLMELGATQRNLQDVVKDQSDSVRALELVHAQSSQLDAHVAMNAATMETLQRATLEKKETREHMQSSLDRCLAEHKQQAATRDRHRDRYDRQLHALRQLVDAIRHSETDMTTFTNRQHAEESFLHQQRRQLDYVARLCEDKMSLLTLEKARHTALMETRAVLDQQSKTNVPSPAALHELALSLSHQKEVLETRLERAQARLSEAIQIFVMEGRRGDRVNEAIVEKQRERRALAGSQETTECEAHMLRERCAQLEELLAERRALLPSMEALALEQRAQRQESWMREIEQLRSALLRAQREHQQLRNGITTLSSSTYRTRKGLEDGGTAQTTTLKALRLLEGEIAALEQEQRITAEEERKAVLQFEQATVTLQSLMKAADTNVGVLKETAGMESFLRAEVQIKEEQIQAEMQGRLVELHLHENELHGLGEELQRNCKKLSLLRMRYEEVMASLARASQKPLNEEKDGVLLPLPALDTVPAAVNPETVHAHLLLRRSFEREQLMQRGNYLDLRLVALDRETSTLRLMLDGMRTAAPSHPNEGASAARVAATGMKKQSGALVSADANALAAGGGPLPSSPAVMKSELLNNAVAKEQYWKVEANLLEEAMTAMSHERDRTRVQLSELRFTLKALQGTEKQKRMRLQKLRELVERSHKMANAAAIRGIK